MFDRRQSVFPVASPENPNPLPQPLWISKQKGKKKGFLSVRGQACVNWMRRNFNAMSTVFILNLIFFALDLPDPSTGIKWLPPGKIFDYYKEMKAALAAEKTEVITETRFSTYWTEFFPEYRILSGKRADKCKECSSFYELLCSNTLSPQRRAEVERDRATHLAKVRVARERYYARQRLAMRHPNVFLSMIVDGNHSTH